MHVRSRLLGLTLLAVAVASVAPALDAHARITRRPAFVEVHIAPGLGNALGMLHNAAIGKTPLVVYAGQSPGATLLQEPHLSGPLVDMARPVCKWAAQVHQAHDVPRALRRAFKVAMEPPQGPVFLSLPMDTLDEEADVDIHPTTHTRWRVDPAGMAEVADLLLGAERPMLMVGDGVALAEAQPEVVELAEIVGLPVFECYLGVHDAGQPSFEPGRGELRHARPAAGHPRGLRPAPRRRRADVPAYLPGSAKSRAGRHQDRADRHQSVGDRQERDARPRVPR